MVVCLSAIVPCVTLSAQESAVPAESSLAKPFRQLDRDGDGKLTKAEAGDRSWFSRLDRNGDGVITLEELPQASPVQSEHPSSVAAGATAPLKPVPRNESAATPFARLVFTKDYFPGGWDVNGQFLGGTEMMWLAGHGGKLFAAVGYGQDQQGEDPLPGAQIIRKDGPDIPWQVDHCFGPDYMRVEGLISMTFSTDARGKPLEKPVGVLIASPSLMRGQDPTISVFTRDDATGQWRRSDITSGYFGVRAFGSHVDKVTGVHHIFAGLNVGDVHRGSYDPAAPGGIGWVTKPEHAATMRFSKDRGATDYGRVLCFAECNGELYMAGRIADDASGQPVDGGLYRRVDGLNASWQLVHRWPMDKTIVQTRYLRGLAGVPDPRDDTRQVLIWNHEYPGLMMRFTPAREAGKDTLEVELDIKEYFNQAWNTPDAQRRGAIAAYNRFLPVTDPVSGEPLWLCGAWGHYPGDPNPPYNGSCYLIRHRDGRYDWGYVYDPAHPVPAGQKLTGTRDIEPSPFPSDQGRVFYFCGYDGGAGPSHNTAWIYRGRLPEVRTTRYE